ncbi:hypothetical protein BVY01_02930 [bacterium I07]|nr:hypothetical protein BVY01_02930 [bacterium I07]
MKYNRQSVSILIVLIIGSGFFNNPGLFAQAYPWLHHDEPSKAICNRIPVPEGYNRVEVQLGSFEYWLRNLSLKPEGSPVYLFDGRRKANQETHVAVVDIDVGDEDLQQCADAIIRLRAEYLFSTQQFKQIHFNFTSGDTAWFIKWSDGYRPRISGPNLNIVQWIRAQPVDSSYFNFRSYLLSVFQWAGTHSLNKELVAVQNPDDMRIGDVFIQGGRPGHAVIVVDMAIHKNSGNQVFLLAQSYMPAQDIHILKNPNHLRFSPWYELKLGENLATPEWTFNRSELKRFR